MHIDGKQMEEAQDDGEVSDFALTTYGDGKTPPKKKPEEENKSGTGEKAGLGWKKIHKTASYRYIQETAKIQRHDAWEGSQRQWAKGKEHRAKKTTRKTEFKGQERGIHNKG